MFEIGNTLREARVRRNLTLQQVEEDTKIRVKYVQAMENEDFDLMPGATYVKGFLRTYSDVSRPRSPTSSSASIARAASRPGRSTSRSAASSMLGAPRGHRGRNTVVFVAVICLLVLGVIYVLGLRHRGRRSPAPSPAPWAS